MMDIGANSHDTQGDNWDEDAAICDGGRGATPRGAHQVHTSPNS